MTASTQKLELQDASTTTTDSGEPLVTDHHSALSPTVTDGITDSSAATAPETIAVPRVELPKDIRFDILKNHRRRLVLEYLVENEGVARLGDLAEYIAAIENDIEVGQLNSKQRKRVYVGLYQAHLPRMAKAGVVDFNPNRGTIALGENAVDVLPYIEDDARPDAAFAPLYVALAAIGAGSLLISQSAGALAGTLGTIVVGLVLLVFFGTAIWQLYAASADE